MDMSFWNKILKVIVIGICMLNCTMQTGIESDIEEMEHSYDRRN